MRTKVTETTVYTWDELSDTAKDNARERHNRFLWDCGSMQESMEMIWEGTLTDKGWENLSNLSYSLYSPGGEPAWSGDLPEWEFEGNVYYVTVRDGRYGMSVSVEETFGEDENPDADEVARIGQAAKDMVQDLSYELLKLMRAEDEWSVNDENMAETSEANGYEYDEDGNLV